MHPALINHKKITCCNVRAQEITAEENETVIKKENDANIKKAEAAVASGDTEAEVKPTKENIGNVAKSGRAYTREELEQQIKC